MKFSILTAVSSVLLAMTFAGTAAAETDHSKVTKVHYNVNSAAGQIAIVMANGDQLFASGDAQSGCPARSAEALRIWTTMAQAALLSSKELDYVYTVTPYAKCIVAVTLQ